MDYEKKYRDLVEAVKELQEANPSDEGIQNWVNDNVPELAESEDERIRKECISIIDAWDKSCRVQGDYCEVAPKCIAWLEKQGEQKSADKVEPKFKIGDIIRLKDGDGLEWTVEKVLNNGYYTIFCADRDDFIQLDDKWELVEQKSAWSEEDEKILKETIVKVEYALAGQGLDNFIDRHPVILWLNSLKDRVLPQPKQEWSEEDEKNFARVDYACLKVYGGDSYSSDWLRKFLGIHKKWKPSDEQMEALWDAIVYVESCNSNFKGSGSVLENLYNDLKKLKG